MLRNRLGFNRANSRGKRVNLTYYRSRQHENSGQSPFVKHSKKSRVGSGMSRAADILIVTVIVAALIYSLIVQPEPVLSVSSRVYHSDSLYLTAVQKQLRALKNRSKITFDEASITASLIQQFPEIDRLSIELPFFGQKPIIKITIAEPSFVLSSGGNSYIVDSKGAAVAAAGRLPQIKNLPRLTDETGFEISAGRQVLSASEVSFISTVIAACQRSKVVIKSLVLPPRAQELNLRSSDRNYFVKFYLGGDAGLQTGQFLAARHQFDKSARQPAEYLDVRVNGKIYYK